MARAGVLEERRNEKISGAEVRVALEWIPTANWIAFESLLTQRPLHLDTRQACCRHLRIDNIAQHFLGNFCPSEVVQMKRQ
eukprot:1324999-Amphidinium_carterae.1